MVNVSYSIAFAAGTVSFFAPCVIPLLPVYISYITGVTLTDLNKTDPSEYKVKILISSLFYILGFSLVFVILGSAASGFGIIFRKYGIFFQRAGGLLIFIFGLEFAGIIKLAFLAKTRSIKSNWVNGFGYSRAFLLGIIFATTWTPCAGAILGSILTLAAVTQTAVKGAVLLFVYSLGISLPFIIISLTFASAQKYLRVIGKYSVSISKIAGISLSFIGLLLLTDNYKYLSSWLFELASRFAWGSK